MRGGTKKKEVWNEQECGVFRKYQEIGIFNETRIPMVGSVRILISSRC